jgi:hypothetical protein
MAKVFIATKKFTPCDAGWSVFVIFKVTAEQVNLKESAEL